MSSVLNNMMMDSLLQEARLKQLDVLEEKGEQMAKFLYPQAVADAFREYAEEVLKMFVFMDKELVRPEIEDFIKEEKKKEKENG